MLTFFDLLDGPDHIIDKRLHITKRVGNACRLVHLCQRGVENCDDILEQFCCHSLLKESPLSSVPPLSLPGSKGQNQRVRKKTYFKDQREQPFLLPFPHPQFQQNRQILI